MTEKQPNFDNLGIAPKILQILDSLRFTEPTPIQAKAIPEALSGKDLIGIAQTGTGKTLAFGIPMIQTLAKAGGQGLVVVPTRELALQVDESLQKVGRQINVRTAVLIGGESIGKQISALKRKPHILVATPGRLNDLMQNKHVNLAQVKVLILDEADRMLDMGFAPQIEKIVKLVPKERQTLLFSATMPSEIVSIARSYMKLPVRVEIAPAGTAAENVEQELYFVNKENKLKLLEKVLGEYRGSVLIFSRTKHGAKKINKAINGFGYTASEIHSNRTLAQRRAALDGFKKGRYKVLVATDIAARGIDVTGIELVLNYDLPETAEDYVHRIGRTGRAGHEGHAISFATPDQKLEVKRIEKLIRSTLPILPLPSHIAQSVPVFAKTSVQPFKNKRTERRGDKHREKRFAHSKSEAKVEIPAVIPSGNTPYFLKPRRRLRDSRSFERSRHDRHPSRKQRY